MYIATKGRRYRIKPLENDYFRITFFCIQKITRIKIIQLPYINVALKKAQLFQSLLSYGVDVI